MLNTKTAKLFQNGQSQAVRLPKEFRFSGDKVFVKKVDNGIILLPAENSWNALFQSINKFFNDFMTTRDQPSLQDREEIFE